MKLIPVWFVYVFVAVCLVFGTCITCMAEDDTEYRVIRKVGEKLYEVTFDVYENDQAEVLESINNRNKGTAQGCTSIWKDGMMMRNLD